MSRAAVLVREALAAMREARAQQHLHRGWEALQERDAEGTAIGPLPWTPEAIMEFEQARRLLPEDSGVLHHLAIATHARLWDREARGESTSVADWRESIRLWYDLTNHRRFWRQMWDHLRECFGEDEVPEGLVEDARVGLLEEVLTAQTKLILWHLDAGRLDQARERMRVLQSAPVSPVVRQRFVESVFGTMRDQAVAAEEEGEHASALIHMERFLALFPDHPEALRRAMDIAAAWLRTLSYETDWDQVVSIAQRMWGPAQRLAAMATQGGEASSGLAVVRMARLMLEMGLNRGRYASGEEGSLQREVEAPAAYDCVVPWGELAQGLAPPGSELHHLLGHCLNDRALLYHAKALGLSSGMYVTPTDLSDAAELWEAATRDLERAIECEPDDDVLRSNLDCVQRSLQALREW